MKGRLPTEIVQMISNMFMATLKQDGYRIELGNDSKIRVTGVQEGELFFALRCKTFKIEKPTPPATEKPQPPPAEKPQPKEE